MLDSPEFVQDKKGDDGIMVNEGLPHPGVC